MYSVSAQAMYRFTELHSATALFGKAQMKTMKGWNFSAMQC